VPRDLERILLRTLAKDPGQRFQSAAGMRDALLACEDAGGWSLGDARRWWKRFEEEHPVLRPEDLLAAESWGRISVDERAAAATTLPGGQSTAGAPTVSDSAATSFGEAEVSDSAETSFD